MPLMTWNSSLSVGITQIDEQHKKLIAIINELHEAMKAGKGRDIMGKVLDGLLQYTQYHFGTEEAYFKQYKYPKEQQHFAEHNALRAQVVDLQNKFKANQLNISLETTAFLKSWLSNHICKNDIEFGNFLQTQGMK